MDIIKKGLPNKFLLVADEFCLVTSFVLAAWIRFGKVTASWYSTIYSLASLIIFLLYVVIYYRYDTYSKLFKRGYIEEFLTVVKINSILAVLLTTILFLMQQGTTYSRLFYLYFFIINIPLNYGVRLLYKIVFHEVYKNSSASKKLMIVTTSVQAEQVLNRIRYENEWEYEVTYLTIIDKPMTDEFIFGVIVKAGVFDIYETARTQVIDEVLIHVPDSVTDYFNLEFAIHQFENMGITVNLSINTFGLKIHEKKVSELTGYSVLTFSSKLFDENQLMAKRLLDITGGIVGCLITIVLTIILAPAIMIESPGPLFFSQVRMGKNGRRFRIYKFRSMYMDAEARKQELMALNEMDGYMFKLTNDPRITKIGAFLRKTSLDEFPQFLNILRGDMSLVGARPPTEEEFLQYEGRHKRRLALKSGLTGLWQVSGRSDITDFEEVVKLDLEYIDNWSLINDIKILLKTIWVVIFGRGSK
ncbi:MAG: exopolysaccharide biosynthesis polyprenyl glycosylphosphotransferase [Anaerocolumna sp.]|jgi:exopolysaccharide biosynthesis polyprenyl glycosylphosphotransferase|nr:exopolysaccharide biosynthesis polyprenyl glycosylphosphotransferase [Anaerocolumna sp.]